MSYINNEGIFLRLTEEEINNIRTSVNIVDVISNYIPLTKRGKNYFGVCPFHDDRDPSLSVSEEKQIYKCFSCGAGGNVFSFIMEYDNVNFIESLKKVANIGGIDVRINSWKSKDNKFTNFHEIYNISNKFYQNNIRTEYGESARKYLKQRQLKSDIINEFEIGLSLKENDVLTNLLLAKGYNLEELIKSGITISGEYGTKDIFYNRIMFPLANPSGKVVGFSGRAYETDAESKYINTMESPIFKKGELLFNYHRARDECRLKKQVIIVEGFMDVIRLYSNNIKNVIATMGTAITKEQALLIKRLSKNAFICFDGDIAGLKATNNVLDELLKVGVNVKVIRLKESLDPDDYLIKYGVDAFNKLILNPLNVMDFKMAYFKENKNLKDQNEMANYIDDLLRELNKLDDDILIELSLTKLSEESKLSINFLRNKFNNLKHNIKSTVSTVSKPKKIINKYTDAERNLLYYMLKSPEVIAIYNNKATFMPTNKYRFLAQEISFYYNENKNFNLADFFTTIIEDKELVETVNEIESLNLKEEYTIQEIDDYLEVIRSYHVKSEQERLMKLLKEELDLEKKAEIAEKIIKLKEGILND